MRILIVGGTVYADFSRPGLDETGAVGKVDEVEADAFTAETYGPLKAACEHEVQAGFGEAALLTALKSSVLATGLN